jgi:hypothetical protein
MTAIRFVLLLCLLLPHLAQASITSVAPSPSSRNVPVSSTAYVTIRWTVIRNNMYASPKVSSTQGTFLTGAGAVGTNNRTLSQSKAVTGSNTTFYFTETVRVPSSITYKVRKTGYANFQYRRTFNDSYSSATGTVTLHITGSSASGFSITRLSLRFDDNATEKLAKSGDSVQAVALITFVGSGRLAAVWEVAMPGSSSGQPVFQPLQLVRRTLVGSTAVISSPRLPTQISGLYLVRLRVTSPSIGDTPQLRYYVYQGTGTDKPPAEISLRSPGKRANLWKWRTFKWSSISSASVYRLEFYNAPKHIRMLKKPRPQAHDQLVTGQEVSADTDKPVARLENTVYRHLKSGQHYLWRVVAIDKKGTVVGESTYRVIRKP